MALSMVCSCCGTEITAPKWNDGKPYGWACYARLFGNAKAVGGKYVPVSGVEFHYSWDPLIERGNLAPDQREIYVGKSKIGFRHANVDPRKLIGVSDLGYKVGDQWFVPESAVRRYLKEARRRHCYIEYIKK